MKTHSKLSPSAAHRWVFCPGSIRLCADIPKKDTVYSIEGTGAHALAELCLRQNIDAKEFIGKKLEINDEKVLVPVTEEMTDAVQIYLDFIRSFKTAPVVETEFDLKWLVKDMKGTCDAYVLKGHVLHVIDLKFGAGVMVYPDNNAQLMIYALGAVNTIFKAQEKTKNIWELIEKVVLTIVQPRAYGEEKIRTWDIALKDLFFWAQTVLLPMAKETEKENAPLRVGEHCRFCPALAICPEQAKNACAIAKTDFEKPVLPLPEKLSPEDISKVLQASEMFSAWADSVKEHALAQMKSGITIPGYKLVAKRANRVWVDEREADKILETHLADARYEKKLLSVAKAEAAFKKKKLPVDILTPISVKPEGGTTIARDDDKRSEKPAPAKLDFMTDLDLLT